MLSAHLVESEIIAAIFEIPLSLLKLIFSQSIRKRCLRIERSRVEFAAHLCDGCPLNLHFLENSSRANIVPFIIVGLNPAKCLQHRTARNRLIKLGSKKNI